MHSDQIALYKYFPYNKKLLTISYQGIDEIKDKTKGML